MRLHAVIISWAGHFEKAHAIARALEGAVDQLTVIYSNTSNQTEDGPGTWVQTPQSWYFGRKFRASLDLMGPQDLMLQIQADAHSNDWPALAAGCAKCFATQPNVALWTPDVNWSPWHADVVGAGMIEQTNLLQVQQTDGIVWALHPLLYPALRAPDYTSNNLGWGIDWLALLTAEKHGMIAVRDLSYPVHHPYGRGYHNTVAAQHMKNFLAQLPAPEQRKMRDAHDALEARKRAFSGHTPSARTSTPPTTETTLMPWPFFRRPLAAKISQTCVIAGNVYVKAAAKTVQGNAMIEYGTHCIPLTPLQAEPPRGHVPSPFPLHPTDTKTAFQQLNDLGEWQVNGWPTLRVIPDFTARQQTIALSGDMTVEPADGPQMFSVHLAVHRGKGNLVVCLSDTSGAVHHETSARFESVYWGGDRAEQYKLVQITLPPHDETLRLTLRIETEETAETTADQPAVFFLARPRLRSISPETLLAPALTQAQKPLGNAVWYTACLDPQPLAGPRDIALVVGKQRISLLSAPNAALTLTRDHGDMLVLNSDTALTASVWLNDAPVSLIALETGDNAVPVPPLNAPDAPSLLELRDASGTLRLWHTWVVPPTPTDRLPEAQTPRDLRARTTARISALRQHLAAPTDITLLPQLNTALAALEAGPQNTMTAPLRFGSVAEPDVNIIVTAHANLSVTYTCLAALLLAWNHAQFTVTLRAGPEDSAGIENLIDGITILRAPMPDQPSQHAPYLVLLDSTTEVTSGWLDGLIATAQRFSRAGAVGAKLLCQDGRLYSAGGGLTHTQTPRPYGTGEAPNDPRFDYARQVAYLPATALLITRTAWNDIIQLGAPADVSTTDIDLICRIRKAGYDTWYAPAAEVYVDTPLGNAVAPDVDDMQEYPKTHGTILVLAEGASALDDIALIRSAGYHVSCFARELPTPQVSALQQAGIEMITPPFYHDLASFLEARGRAFDAFYLVGCDLARATMQEIRRINPLARLVLLPLDLTATDATLSSDDVELMRSVDAVVSDSPKITALKDTEASNEITLIHGQSLTHDTVHIAFPPADGAQV